MDTDEISCSKGLYQLFELQPADAQVTLELVGVFTFREAPLRECLSNSQIPLAIASSERMMSAEYNLEPLGVYAKRTVVRFSIEASASTRATASARARAFSN
jgi:hypothetical protein